MSDGTPQQERFLSVDNSQAQAEDLDRSNPQNAFIRWVYNLLPKSFRDTAMIVAGGFVVGYFLLDVGTKIHSIIFPSDLAAEVEGEFKDIFGPLFAQLSRGQSSDGGITNPDLPPAWSTVDQRRLEELASKAPNDQEFLGNLTKAGIAFSNGTYEKVFQYLPKNLDVRFKDISEDAKLLALRLRGLTHYRMNEWELAKKDFKAVLAIDPENWLGRSSIGALEISLGNYTAAKKIFDQLLLPHSVPERDERYELNLANAFNNRGIANQKLREFESAKFDYNKAVDRINDSTDPGYQSLVTKAIALNNLGTTLVAEAWERATQSSAPDDNEESSLKPFEDAVEKYNKAADVLLKEIDTDLAKYNRNDLAMIYTNRAIARSYLGKDTFAEFDFKKSIEIRRKLIAEGRIELIPSLVNSLDNLAILYQKKERWEEMVETCTSAIEMCNSGVCLIGNDANSLDYAKCLLFSYSLRALGYEALQRLIESRQDFEEVVTLFRAHRLELENSLYEDDYHTALNNLAWQYATAADEKYRDAERAVVYAEEVCELNEENPVWEFLDTLAAAYANIGDFPNAKSTQKISLEYLSKAFETDASGQGEGVGGGLSSDEYLSLKDELTSRAELYENGLPFWEDPHETKPQEQESETPQPDQDSPGQDEKNDADTTTKCFPEPRTNSAISLYAMCTFLRSDGIACSTSCMRGWTQFHARAIVNCLVCRPKIKCQRALARNKPCNQTSPAVSSLRLAISFSNSLRRGSSCVRTQR